MTVTVQGAAFRDIPDTLVLTERPHSLGENIDHEADARAIYALFRENLPNRTFYALAALMAQDGP